MRDAVEIRHGRQEMRYMSADQSMRPGHAIYGQLYQHSALLRVPSPRGEFLSHEHFRPLEKLVSSLFVLDNCKSSCSVYVSAEQAWLRLPGKHPGIL